MVCIGFFCLPNKSSITFLSAADSKSLIDILGTPPLLTASSNAVLFTKKSGILNNASEGLSILNPLGSPAVFNTLFTICSASKSVIGLPACAALSLNNVLAFSTASAAGLYLNQGKILLS